MKLKEWGENNFIEYLVKLFPYHGSIIGIGDDCAVIPMKGKKAWLVTTDALIEGIHFLKEEIPPRELGYKTIAVNVSDIAAMGGEPKYAFLSIALNKTIDCKWMRYMIHGIKEACQKWNIELLGGDTVGSKRDLFLNLALIGSIDKEKIKYRHTAEEGDLICVTGCLGDSGGGLRALQEKIKDADYLIHTHFHPEPQPKQGKWLASQGQVHAMMDISDGLDSDLTRLIKSSKKGAVIEITKLPISEQLKQTCIKEGWDALKMALVGGEDYSLLLTISKDAFASISNSFKKQFKTNLVDIGYITKRSNLIYRKNGKTIKMHYANFDHFK